MTMRPPELALAITVSPARLLGGLLLLAIVVSTATLLAWRRMRAAAEAVDEPLQRLRGFHIFGPDDDDGDRPPLHTPVLLREASRPAGPGGDEARLRGPVLKAVPLPGATAP